MSLDLAVLAMSDPADAEQARAMAERCWRSAAHPEGELDPRIAAFHEELLSRFPPGSPDSPWTAGIDAGIDHVIVNLSWSASGTPAIEAIQGLAAGHGLVVYDPQSGDVCQPGQ